MEFQLQHLLLVFFLLSLYPDGTLQCNCDLGKCAADGSCEKGYSCKSGYFGDFCRYFDVLDHERFIEAELRVEDYSMCPAINRELRFTYINSSMKIYMVRIVGSFGNMPSTFTFAFKDKGNEFSCDGSLVKLNDYVLEYYCARMNFSQELIIGNIDGKKICHVAATEGANMVQKGTITTKMKSSNDTFYSTSGLIDGNREHVQGSCFLTGTLRFRESISFTLIAPSFVNYVQVFGNTELGNSSTVGTAVSLVDTNRKYRLSSDIKELQAKIYYSVPGSAIQSVNAMKSARFGACEVEVIGDCINGTYGNDCKSICKRRCKNSRCTSKGHCIGCIEGQDLTGLRCCKKGCDPTKDCGDDGSCVNGCAPKMYGKDCNEECSPNCDGSGDCDLQTGACPSGCKPGYFTPKCSIPCSPNCLDSGSCHNNGNCISGCKPGYSGHDCNIYPVGCNCADFKCTATGTCEKGYQCKDHYFGLYCEYAEVEDKRINKPELSDKDLTTCATVQGELVVSYKGARVYMVRLIVEDSSKFEDISFMFKDKGEMRYCEGHLVVVESTVLEYYCDMLNISQELIIGGIGGHKICHVYLTEGQNMNLKPYNISSTSSSSDVPLYNVHGLVDGNRQHIPGSCFRARPFKHTEYVAIFFGAPVVINFVQFYGLTGEGNTFNIDATVSLFDTHTDFYEVSHVYTQSARVYSDHFGQNINLFETVHTHPFGLCEIELIGACAHGTYGPGCSNKCTDRCKDSRCTNEGYCLSCKEGLRGRYCCQPYCDGGCNEQGTCDKSCTRNKFGADCSQDCSPYCATGEGCDSTSGLCKSGCSHGFFGEQCTHLGLRSKMSGTETMTCHCSGGKCNNPTDKCQDFENCIAGWFGYNCAYKDLSVLGTTSDEVLNDNNKDTCLHNTDSYASVGWDEPILFSFVILTFKEDVDIESFMLMGKTGDVENTYAVEETKIKVIKDHVFQISLSSRVEVNEMTISWLGTGSLCSLSVSGDRNLAVEFATSPEIAENPAVKDVVGALTDGNIAGENCLNRKLKNILRFQLPHSVLISRVNIYPALYNKEKVSFNLTRRSTDSSSSQLVAIQGNKYATVFLPSKEMFNAIEFQQINGDADICEIEIFGECVSPYYGFACRDRCRESCTRQECDYTGQCLDTGLRMAQRARSESPHTKASSYAIVSLIVIMALI